MLLRLAALLILIAVPAFVQAVPPVSARACTVTSVATGSTAVTAFAGPGSGFILQNPRVFAVEKAKRRDRHR
jgi:hypothetical protein